MSGREGLIEKIQAADFSCKLCGACCSGADNDVMVTPDEVDALCTASGLSFSEIAEPSPDWMEYLDGTKSHSDGFFAAGLTGTVCF